MSLFYSNPLGGRVGIFTILCESVDVVTQLNCFDFGGFAAIFLRISLRQHWHIISMSYFSLTWFDFFYDI